MVSIHYYLHAFVSKEGNSSLYVRVHADGIYHFRAATHERIKPKNWNHKKQIVKADQDYAAEINKRLERIKNKIAQVFREKLDEAEEITIEDLKTIIRPRSKADLVKTEESISDIYEAWKKHYLAELNLGNTGEQKGLNYTRKFKQVVDHIETFAPGTTLSKIDPSFLKKYRAYLIENKKIQDSTVNQHFKCIRALLTFKGLPVHLITPPKAPKATKYDLSWKEVQQLLNTDYSTKRLKEVAYIFVANCQLCLRYTDLYKLDKAFVTVTSKKYGEVLCINLTQGKTGDPIFIPVPKLAKAILERFDYKFPLGTQHAKGVSSYFNVWLKQAAQEAKLTRLIRVTKSHNNHITESKEPLHKLISSHDARHTGYSRIKEITKDKDLAEALLGHSDAGPYSHTDPLTVVDALLDAWALIDKA